MLSLSAAAQNARIVLRWKEVPGASAYELQIAKDAAFVEVVLQTRTTSAGYRWEQLPTTTHWWRVRSFDAESRASEWSQPRTVAVDTAIPAPLKPLDGVQLACGAGVTFELDTSPLVKEFLVELSTSAEFSSFRTLRSGTPSLEAGALPPGTWWWRTRAVDIKGRTSGPGPVRTLHVRVSPPRLKPIADVVLGTPQVQLTWNEAGCAKSYVVEASLDGKNRVSLASPTNALAFKAGSAGDYRWRVASVDERGNVGEFSPEGAFKVRLPTPVPRGESVSTRAELSWGPVVGATSYRVELLRTGAKEPLATSQVSGTSWRSAELSPGEYRWRVTARDAAGHQSNPSDLRSFVRVAGAPLPAVSWLEPGGDRVVPVGTELELSWSSVAGARQYELEVDGVSSALGATRSRTPRLAEGAHVVRVRAMADGYRFSEWAALELYAGVPPVARAEVTLVGEQVRVRLFDAKGRLVEGARPRLAVRSGALGAVEAVGGSWQAQWTPAAEQEDVLLIDEREFHAEERLRATVDPFLAVAVRAGGIFSGGAVASPSFGAGLGVRLPWLRRRIGLELRAGGYGAGASVDLGGEPVRAQALLFPISLVVGWHQNVGAFQLRGSVGPALQVAWVHVGGESATTGLPGVEALVSLSRRVGPGRLEAEVSFVYSRLDIPLARLNAGGVAVRVGYAFDFLPEVR
ncbi:MAG: hypothetical protein ACOZQL_35585 [Myxococcota bacterium]